LVRQNNLGSTRKNEIYLQGKGYLNDNRFLKRNFEAQEEVASSFSGSTKKELSI
jgi:hypothetical protein